MKRYTEEQIIGFLREADAGMPAKKLCRKHGFSERSYYAWQLVDLKRRAFETGGRCQGRLRWVTR